MKSLELFKNILRYKNYSERTIQMYVFYVGRFVEELNIKDPYQLSINMLVEYLHKFNYSSISQQNQIINSLKLFYKYILKKSDIHLDKIERPRKEKKLPTIISKEFMLDRINKIENKKHKAIISLAYSVGLRVSEVINLKINDIDSKRMIITIKQAKGNKDRIVPLSEKVLSILRDYFKEFKPKDYLFNGQDSLQYSSTSCNCIVKKYLGKNYHFHLLRHSAFTNLVDCGTDISIVQKLAGHSSIKTTSIYLHLSNAKLQNLPLAL